ncbi:hypothetical protein Tco_0378164 [Tanacetum coccineum]
MLKTLGERGIECIFIGYAELSKAFRFSSVPRPSLRIPNGTEDIGSSVVLEEVTEEVSDQHSYCFNVEDDPKTFDEAMKSLDVVDLTKEFLSSRFSMKDMGEADVILRIRIKHESNRIAISQSYYIEKGDWLLDLCHRSALGMERDCQHGLYKAGMGSSRVLSDFAEKYGSKNRVLAGFGIGGKSGKEKFEPSPRPSYQAEISQHTKFLEEKTTSLNPHLGLAEWDITTHLLLAPYDQMYASLA